MGEQHHDASAAPPLAKDVVLRIFCPYSRSHHQIYMDPHSLTVNLICVTLLELSSLSEESLSTSLGQ